MVTHTIDKQVRLYKVGTVLYHMRIDPQLVRIVENFGPLIHNVESLPLGYERIAKSSKLSLLILVPSGPESKTRSPTPPFILAGYSYLSDDFQAGGEQMTTICKLTIQRSPCKLHPSFGTQPAKGALKGTNEVVRSTLHDSYRS